MIRPTTLLLVTLLAATGRADDESLARQREYEAVRAAHGPALVTIRYVQKTQARFGDFEGENEINGVLVAPDGLVLCSNTLLGGGRRGGRSVPSEIKVLMGGDPVGLDATFIARDTELDLAWLKIKNPPAAALPFVELTPPAENAVKAQLGQRVLALGVMGRFFGQVVLVTDGIVAGRTHKPRELYVVRGNLDTDPGLPVFTTSGQVVGVATIQQPDEDELAGNTANLVARGRGLILPAGTVARATARARELEKAGVKVEPAPEAPRAESPNVRERAEDEPGDIE